VDFCSKKSQRHPSHTVNTDFALKDPACDASKAAFWNRA